MPTQDAGKAPPIAAGWKLRTAMESVERVRKEQRPQRHKERGGG